MPKSSRHPSPKDLKLLSSQTLSLTSSSVEGGADLRSHRQVCEGGIKAGRE